MAPTPMVAEALSDTAEAFAGACNATLVVAVRERLVNKFRLQRLVYRDIRERFDLTANLAVEAVCRVSNAVKVAAKRGKSVARFLPTSVDYDQRIFAYRERDESVSLSTVHGRMHVPLRLGKYQRDALRGKTPTCARLVKNGRIWDIHIVVEEADPSRRGGPPLGIDLGIRNIATLSTGKTISGKKIQARKDKFHRVRASLQNKGTTGAKRVLRRLAGRERRFIAAENHRVSRNIVRAAVGGGFGAVRMEDLRGIRQRTRTWNKHRNRMMAGWSFAELQAFLRYKAERAGLSVETVDPAWTSQTCSLCGARGVRNGERFSCATCGGALDADVNAARNIAGGARAGEIPAVSNGARIAGDRRMILSVVPHAKAAGL